jgi:RNA polymerase primary sigma factor
VSAFLSDVHPTLQELIELAAKRGWISYEELNTTLPDEMVDPEKLDELLTSIEALGVTFINEELWFATTTSRFRRRSRRISVSSATTRSRDRRRHG